MASRLEQLDRDLRRLSARVNALTKEADRIDTDVQTRTRILTEGKTGQVLKRQTGKRLQWMEPPGEKNEEFLWPETNDGSSQIDLTFGEWGETKIIGATVIVTNLTTGKAGIYQFTFGYSDNTYKALELYSGADDDIVDVFTIAPFEDSDGNVSVRMTLSSSSINAAFRYKESFAV